MDDELVYELNLRQLSATDPRRLERLAEQIDAKVRGENEAPLDKLRLTRHTVSGELKECSSKLAQLVVVLNDAAQNRDDELSEQGQSWLVHLYGRVQRLLQFAPEHAAVIRLSKQVDELIEFQETVGLDRTNQSAIPKNLPPMNTTRYSIPPPTQPTARTSFASGTESGCAKLYEESEVVVIHKQRVESN